MNEQSDQNNLCVPIKESLIIKSQTVGMFLINLFRSSQSEIQQPKSPLPKRLQKFASFIYFEREPVKSSQMRSFYLQIQEQIQKQKPEFLKLFEAQKKRVKKYLSSWNCSDFVILCSCIEKSMGEYTLGYLAQHWSAYLSNQYLNNKLDLYNSNSGDSSYNQQMRALQRQIQKQIYIFSEVLYELVYYIYYDYFDEHSKRRQKDIAVVYKDEKPVIQSYIVDAITGHKHFEHAKNQHLDNIFEGEIIHDPAANLQSFLLKHFGVETSYTQVYKQTAKAIYDFHKEPRLSAKIKKALDLIRTIDQDHKKALAAEKKLVKPAEEALLPILLPLLFREYCPKIKSSIVYLLKLVNNHMHQETPNPEDRRSFLHSFCLLWLEESTNSELQRLLRVFEPQEL